MKKNVVKKEQHLNDEPSKLALILAFLAVYLIWGSTYLAIRFAVETLPPLLMASVRFFFGGLLFWLLAKFQGAPKTDLTEKKWSWLTGLLMLGIGGGAVHWSEQYVPSGLTALVVASVPFWIVLADWLRPSGERPRFLVILGLIGGFIGITLLIKPEETLTESSNYIIGIIVILIGTIGWAVGSILSRYAPLPKSRSMATALKLFAGSFFLLILGLLSNEWQTVRFEQISLLSVLSLVYLIIFGSLGFFAYNWLLKASTPTKASTYAYINPAIAILLGVIFAGEVLSSTMFIAMLIILTSVAIIVTYGKDKPKEEDKKQLNSSGSFDKLSTENPLDNSCPNQSSV